MSYGIDDIAFALGWSNSVMETIYGHNAIPYKIIQVAAGFHPHELYHVKRIKVAEWVNQDRFLRNICARLIFPWADEELHWAKQAQEGADDKKRKHEYAGRIRFLEFLVRGREYLFVWLVELQQQILEHPNADLHDCGTELFDASKHANKKKPALTLVSHTAEFASNAPGIASKSTKRLLPCLPT
ncbi:hypothetical protein BCR44DRAFT_350373 [Catenaria anguillulae PL171]|uniref:Uncharacterized protein n=1 Tax=Catenaria anguillulae PL171 TaxID=765915 RepID=A0A1Y2HGR2_9FUNG|nr:hypothetical protein BCR44DRAFT_350373 [Catenaria anguillulae PL171]